MNAAWSTTRVSPMLLRVDVELPTTTDRFTCLLNSDIHWDHPQCNRRLYERHLDEALEKNAPVFGFGDMFCLMQMPKDPRMTKGATRPEHNRTTYLDAIVEDAGEKHEKYAPILASGGVGNHETSVMRLCGTNLIHNFAKEMRSRGGIMEAMGYAYWVFFCFTVNGTKKVTKRLFGHHGPSKGSGGEVTKGVLNAPRFGLVYPDADILVYGHNHWQWAFPITRQRMNRFGIESKDEQLHLQLPSYKDELTGKTTGFPRERGFKPQPEGACWLEFEPRTFRQDGAARVDVIIHERRAK